MWDKCKSKNAITGLGAWLLSIASFTAQLILAPEGVRIMWLSPLGISTITLFILGTWLVCWSIFKRELTFPEKQAVLEQRKDYLPKLKEIINKRITRENELAEIAIKTPLKVYYDKCLKYNPKYLRSGKPTDILHALYKEKFLKNNQYFKLLKDGETKYRQIIADYELVYTDIDKRKLKQLLDKFWEIKHQVNSSDIMATLSKKNPKVPNYTSGYKIGGIGENINKKVLEQKREEITEYIKLLLSGGDL